LSQPTNVTSGTSVPLFTSGTHPLAGLNSLGDSIARSRVSRVQEGAERACDPLWSRIKQTFPGKSNGPPQNGQTWGPRATAFGTHTLRVAPFDKRSFFGTSASPASANSLPPRSVRSSLPRNSTPGLPGGTPPRGINIAPGPQDIGPRVKRWGAAPTQWESRTLALGAAQTSGLLHPRTTPGDTPTRPSHGARTIEAGVSRAHHTLTPTTRRTHGSPRASLWETSSSATATAHQQR